MMKEKEAAAAAAPAQAGDRDVEATPASPPSRTANAEEAKAESVEVQVKAEAGGAVADATTEEKAAVSDEVQKILDEDAKQFPVWAWSLLIPMTAFTVVYSLVKNIIRNDENCSDA